MSAGPPTSTGLLNRLRNRDDWTAWAEFVTRHAPVVFEFFHKCGLADADAADLTRDVLRSVGRAISRFEYAPARGGLRSWLFNLALNHLASFRRRTTEAGADGPPAPGVGYEAMWEEEWRRALFARACEHVRGLVEPPVWEVFHRTVVLGHGGPSVAADLGLSAGAVYVAKSRVLARLREFVQTAEEG